MAIAVPGGVGDLAGTTDGAGGFGHAEEAGGTVVYTMDLNCNLQSKTIEQVLGMRKEQCVELAGVVRLGVERELAELSADRWGHGSCQTLQVSGDLERLT